MEKRKREEKDTKRKEEHDTKGLILGKKQGVVRKDEERTVEPDVNFFLTPIDVLIFLIYYLRFQYL